MPTPNEKLPPCPVCGKEVSVTRETQWSFVVKCKNGLRWHEFTLNRESEYRALCSAVERGKNADSKML